MLAIRPPATATDQSRIDREVARRLISTDYSRQLVASAIHEALVEALHLRGGALGPAERAWLRDWLAVSVPRLTERTIHTLATQLEAALWTAPAGVLDRVEERRLRADLGVE
jgi:hypothetical protein